MLHLVQRSVQYHRKYFNVFARMPLPGITYVKTVAPENLRIRSSKCMGQELAG